MILSQYKITYVFPAQWLILSILFFSIYTFADENLNNIVGQQRKIIYLLSDPNLRDDVLERDRFITRSFYYQKRELLEEYEHIIVALNTNAKPSLGSRWKYEFDCRNNFLFIDFNGRTIDRCGSKQPSV